MGRSAEKKENWERIPANSTCRLMHRLVLLLLVVEFVISIALCVTGYSEKEGWTLMPVLLMLLSAVLFHAVYMKKGDRIRTVSLLLVMECIALISLINADCGPESYSLAIVPVVCIAVLCVKGMAAEMGWDH